MLAMRLLVAEEDLADALGAARGGLLPRLGQAPLAHLYAAPQTKRALCARGVAARGLYPPGVDSPNYVKRIDPGSGAGRVRALAARAAAVWRAPEQRQLALALLAALGSALVLARVAEDYLTNDPLARWDVSFARWLSEHRESAVVDLFRVITIVGSPAFALALAIVVSVVLYRRRRIVDAAFLPLVLGGAELLNLVLKLAFHRPRPAVGFVHLDTYSFPSGHAMISTAAYGAFACLLWSRIDSRRAQTLMLAATVLVVTLICFSRLYLGVHYLSDVLAGVAGGATWLALSIALRTVYGGRLVARFTGSDADRVGRRLTRSRSSGIR